MPAMPAPTMQTSALTFSASGANTAARSVPVQIEVVSPEPVNISPLLVFVWCEVGRRKRTNVAALRFSDDPVGEGLGNPGETGANESIRALFHGLGVCGICVHDGRKPPEWNAFLHREGDRQSVA